MATQADVRSSEPGFGNLHTVFEGTTEVAKGFQALQNSDQALLQITVIQFTSALSSSIPSTYSTSGSYDVVRYSSTGINAAVAMLIAPLALNMHPALPEINGIA